MPKQKSLPELQNTSNLPVHGSDPCVELLALNQQLQQQLAEQGRLLEQAQQRVIELEERNYFIDSLIQHLPTPIFVKEAKELRFVSWNKASEDLFGLTSDQVLGKNDYDFFPQQEADFFTSKDRIVLAGNQILDISEEPVHTPNQGIHFLHTKKVPILGGDGQPKYLLAISEDITARKQNEETLRQFNRVVESSPAVLFSWLNSPEAGWPVNLVSQNVTRFGYTAEEFLSGAISFVDIMYPADVERINREIEAYIIGGVDQFQLSYRILTKDGQIRWVDDYTTIERDVQGQVTRAQQGLLLDVTERKLVEEELYRLSRAVEQSSSTIVITDTRGCIEYANPRFTETTGYTLAEARGQHTRLLKSGHTSANEYQHLWEAISTGHEWRGEFHNKRKNGEFYWESAAISPIKNADGVITHFLAVKEEITARKEAEEALRNSEARQRALIEAIPDLMIRMRQDGTYLDFKAPQDFKTYKPVTDFTDKNVVDMLPPELALQRLEYISQALQTGQPQIFEYALPFADGLHYQEARIVPSGKDEVLTIIRDITDRKQAEESLRKSEARNRALLNAFPDLIMQLRRDGTYLDVKVAKDIKAVAPPSELLGKKVSDVLPSEIAERRMRSIEQALQTGQPQISEQQFLRDNQIYDEEVRIVPSGEDEVLVIVRDITKRKHAERQLHQNQSLLQAVIDNTAASIYVLDAQGRFLLINNTFAELFNLDKKAVIGKTDYDIFPQDAAADYQSGDLEILKTGVPVQVEEYVPREDGLHTYVTLKFPLFDETGQPFAVCGLSTDITERKQAEANLAKRATELETVAEVGTAVSTILETNNLLQLVVDLAKSRFNLYHAHIYLLNPSGTTLALAAATGTVGQKMLAQNWQIPLSREQSLEARAARTHQGVIANNVRSRVDFLANPLLPETQAEMAIPIISGNNVLGVLDVQSDKIDYFTNEDIRVQTVLADQVAAALQNAGLFQEMQLALNETEALNRIARTLGQLTDIRTLAETALVEYLYILDLPQGGVLLFDEHRVNGTLIALVKQGQLVEPGIKFPIAGNPSYEEMLTTKESVIINDALTDPLLEVVRNQVHQLGIKSLLLVPIIVRNEVIGALGADSTEFIHEFSAREAALVRAVADQLGVAIENQRLFAGIQAALTETERLYEAGRRIIAAPDVQEMAAAVAEVELVPVINRVLVFLPEQNVQGQIEAMVVAANWYSGQGSSPSPIGRRYPTALPSTDLMLTQEALFVDDVLHDQRFVGPVLEVFQRQNIRSMAILPMWVADRQVGAILLEAEETYQFTPREIQPYLSLASQVAVAIENRRLLEEAQARARREQILREVTTRVRNAVDAETIMRTAVQEVGRTLGRPAFIYLGDGEQPAGSEDTKQPAREGN